MSGSSVLPRRTLAIAHPTADVYGADLQLVQTVAELTRRGWRVVVAITEDGPLVPMLAAAGAQVGVMDFPVLRRASLSPAGITKLAASSAAVQGRLIRFLKEQSADALLVNTVTLPWWLLAGRAARVATICHVHEAEAADSRLIRTALNGPLLLAERIIFNSRASQEASVAALPRLAARGATIYNGVPGPERELAPIDLTRRPLRLAMVCRLSPRKRCIDAVDAVGLLKERGVEVTLDLHGSVFAGYEWYEQELRSRIEELGLTDRVRLRGYGPVWAALEAAEVFLAPSSREPFGNVVVEALLAGRVVIAAAAGGHLEILTDGVTGRLVPPEDPQALADAIQQVGAEPEISAALARAGQQDARERFSVQSYGAAVAALIEDALAAGAPRG